MSQHRPQTSNEFPEDGRRRAVIENITPQVDDGRFAIKRVIGEKVVVRADVFCDGHDEPAALLLYRHESEEQWHKVPMRFLVNDAWEAAFQISELGVYYYTVEARVDHFVTWQKDLAKRFSAGQDLAVDREIGARLVESFALRAGSSDAQRLRQWASRLRQAPDDASALRLAQDPELTALMERHYDPHLATLADRTFQVLAERQRALFSSWYELFPRSTSGDPSQHGTFRDCEKLLPEIARMGFDVLYFPPIHPIGLTNRKGRNNQVVAEGDDPGSPWAIGGAKGGHKAVHPDLGTLEDFRGFIAKAAEHGLEVALDIAFQCSPDHPYVHRRKQWFRQRPDGTVQYAENPPKKYQDIIPFDFECDDWRNLWEELRSIFEYWIEQGVTIFRVDNPHTKAFGFWQYVIGEIKKEHPETIFLSEAFTRPKVMYRLAKVGFTQSYTYFTWRNTKWELEQYMQELSTPPVRDFFRPNFWPNTPDILPEILQYGGRPAFMIRFILAATLSASYGIYGPPFELFVNTALPGSEEYLDSEKYEIKNWDWENADHMRELIARVNRIRRDNPALQTTWNVHFCKTDNDNLICYVKTTEEHDNILLVAVNLDPFHKQAGHIRLPMESLGLSPGHPFLAHDLLGDGRNIWHSEWNPIELDPHQLPAAVFRLYPRLRREQDFDYFM
ncbi:alpha-1,4-glucan--maltose-1-phosphate maltosyltransferase [Geoalkalibacter subterraneus]|uniref:alpha-1,4-glucan--maltose-1-phosphate maltosyltransferase n=1 Tax=Geoalkalibacter subterraneus TaxID=483547 RepID=UPI0006939E1D|nr:alpha-1,4-glucan--maltose-1-phosphate maltosyltransferase [Geoalkalibacter subterraneus]